MRILHLVHQYTPDFVGGTEIYTQAVARRQAAFGNQVAIFVPSPAGQSGSSDLPPATVEDGVTVYRTPVGERTATQIFLQGFRQAQLLNSWRAVLRVEQPEIVHIEHLLGMPFDLVAELWERKIPYVVTLHDYWYVCANAQLLTNTDRAVCAGPDVRALNCARCALARGGYQEVFGLKYALAPLLRRRNARAAAVLQGAEQLIAPTRFVRDVYGSLRNTESKITVLRHGTELPREGIANALREADSRVRDGRLRIGYIGSIAWQKGVHVLVDAVNSLPEEAVSLTIFGDLTAFPDYVSGLQDLIGHPGIQLAGTIDRHEIWGVIARFDVVVVPTLWYETSVLVIDEVFAAGVPVIGSEIGVLREKIEDGVNGRLFTPGDGQALRAIIEMLIVEPETLNMWRRGIPPVFTLDEHIRGLEEIYARALKAV